MVFEEGGLFPLVDEEDGYAQHRALQYAIAYCNGRRKARPRKATILRVAPGRPFTVVYTTGFEEEQYPRGIYLDTPKGVLEWVPTMNNMEGEKRFQEDAEIRWVASQEAHHLVWGDCLELDPEDPDYYWELRSWGQAVYCPPRLAKVWLAE